MGLTGEMYDAITRIVDERVKEIRVTREMHDRLVEAVNSLAEAQKRTELTISTLTDRLTRLEASVEELAEAQKRTEVALLELAEAQKRTDQAVGRLSDVIGHDLESMALVHVPDWLQVHMGVKVQALERRIFKVDGRDVEVNLYGEGVKGRRTVAVVGEVKATIYQRDVAAFSGTADQLRDQLPAKPVKVLFGFWVHPSAEVEARRLGVLLIAPPVRYMYGQARKRA